MNMTETFKYLTLLNILLTSVNAFSSGFTSSTQETAHHLIQKFLSNPQGLGLLPSEEWLKGATMPGPKWANYPSNTEGTSKCVSEIGLHEFEIQLPSEDGFKRRNIAVNRTLSELDSKREAMPEGIASLSLSLYESGVLRPSVVEWLHVKYRKEIDSSLDRIEEAKRIISENNLSYNDIWFDKPSDSVDLDFDCNGRPLCPSPYVLKNGICGHGFYFRLGANEAADALVTFQHNDRVFAVLNTRNEPGQPLSFPAGMIDIEDNSCIDSAFRELKEETGIHLDLVKMEHENRVERVWHGIVAGEVRQTRNAWTHSNLYHAHFRDLNDLKTYLIKINPDFDREEIKNRLIIDISYVIKNYLAHDASQKMFASHKNMLSFALGKFFSENPLLISTLNDDTESIHEASLKFEDLRDLLSFEQVKKHKK